MWIKSFKSLLEIKFYFNFIVFCELDHSSAERLYNNMVISSMTLNIKRPLLHYLCRYLFTAPLETIPNKQNKIRVVNVILFSHILFTWPGFRNHATNIVIYRYGLFHTKNFFCENTFSNITISDSVMYTYRYTVKRFEL